MRLFFCLCVGAFLLSIGTPVHAQSAAQDSILYPEMRTILLEMAEIDQSVRRELIAKGMGNLDSLDLVRQYAIDEVHQKLLSRLVNEYGWPTARMVGVQGVAAAFLIVQHGSYPFQKKMLPHVRTSFEQGDLSASNYALLTDRVLVAGGSPQLFGTQAEIRNGWLVLFPMEDRDLVDKRRSELGLETLESYIRQLESLYGVRWKPTNQ